jgi:hypothetical protein
MADSRIIRKFKNSDENYRKFSANNLWVSDNMEILKRKYLDEYVLVVGEKVVDHGDDPRRLVGRNSGKYVGQGPVFHYVGNYKLLLASLVR